MSAHNINEGILSPADSSKFTYDASNPGLLDITLVGETYSSTLNDSIVWSMEPIGNSTLLTPSSALRGDTVTYSYQGLPDQNVDFGPKRVIASLPAYNVADTVTVLIFFPRDVANNRLAGLPNWYYYWWQTSASLGNHRYNGNAGPRTFGLYIDGQTYFSIFDAAKDSFALECTTGVVCNGIDNFAVTCRHENQHLTDYLSFWGVGVPRDTITVDKDPGTPLPLRKGDCIPDSLEPGMQLDSLLWDTNNDGHYDFDTRGYEAECNWIKGSADHEDWANPGHQY